MMPLNKILRKCTAGYKFTKHLVYMDNVKLKEKRIGKSNTCSQNIQSRHKDGI